MRCAEAEGLTLSSLQRRWTAATTTSASPSSTSTRPGGAAVYPPRSSLPQRHRLSSARQSLGIASTLRTSDPAYRNTPCGTAARCAANSHRHAAQRVPNSQLLEWAASATANLCAVAALTHMPPCTFASVCADSQLVHRARHFALLSALWHSWHCDHHLGCHAVERGHASRMPDAGA